MIKSNNIIGQKEILRHINNVINAGNIPNSYIIEGPKGSGKKLITNYYASLLLCENKVKGEMLEPCGSCHSCLQTETHNNPDIIYVTHEKPNTISVDEVRSQLVNDIEIKPYYSQYKIYIIDEADKLTREAQNAMLKSIEEPPEYAIIFLLVSSKEKLLPTILSRCVKLSMKPLGNDSILEYLADNNISVSYNPDEYINFANGHIGKAIELLQNDELSDEINEIASFCTEIDNQKLYDTELVKEKLKGWKDKIEIMLDYLVVWYRDVLMTKAGMPSEEIYFQTKNNTLQEQSFSYTYQQLFGIINCIEETKTRISNNVNYDLAMEMLFIEIRNNRR